MLGPDHRFTTDGRGRPRRPSDGVVAGDVWLVWAAATRCWPRPTTRARLPSNQPQAIARRSRPWPTRSSAPASPAIDGRLLGDEQPLRRRPLPRRAGPAGSSTRTWSGRSSALIGQRRVRGVPAEPRRRTPDESRRADPAADAARRAHRRCSPPAAWPSPGGPAPASPPTAPSRWRPLESPPARRDRRRDAARERQPDRRARAQGDRPRRRPAGDAPPTAPPWSTQIADRRLGLPIDGVGRRRRLGPGRRQPAELRRWSRRSSTGPDRGRPSRDGPGRRRRDRHAGAPVPRPPVTGRLRAKTGTLNDVTAAGRRTSRRRPAAPLTFTFIVNVVGPRHVTSTRSTWRCRTTSPPRWPVPRGPSPRRARTRCPSAPAADGAGG